MTVKDILKTACVLLDNKNAYTYIDELVFSGDETNENDPDSQNEPENEPENEPTQESSCQDLETAISDTDVLLSVYNMIQDEIATEFYSMVCEEKFEGVSGVLLFRDFTYSPLAVLTVRNQNKKPIFADILPNRIEGVNGTVYVKYKYVPNALTIGQTSPYTDTPITTRVLALGVASEYLLIKGNYEQAITYHKQYIESLKGVLSNKKPLKIKGRAWL